MEIFRVKETIDFMKYRTIAVSASALGVLLSIIITVYPGPNYGVDFKGGTELQIKFNEALEQGKLRDTLSSLGYDAEVVSVEGSRNEYIVRVADVSSLPPQQFAAIRKAVGKAVDGVGVDELKVSPGGDKISFRMKGEIAPEKLAAVLKAGGAHVRDVLPFGSGDQHRYEAYLVGVADEMLRGLKDKLGKVAPDAPRRVEWVGPKAGKQLRDSAVLSMLWAVMFIMAYVALRFDLRFAPGGIVALLHDAIITLGVFVAMRREVNLSTVAALLTILGYSINDTIVIYDRIRENMGRMRDVSLYRLINISTTQTLSRTLLTSFATLLSISAFFFWGTPVIKDFAFAMLIGLTVGVYSTIYVAAPVTEWIDRRFFSKAA